MNFIQTFLESSLYQYIHEPTCGESILDIVLSTNDNQINNVDIGPEFSTSDQKVSSSPSNVTLECIIIVMKKCQIFGELTLIN